MTATATRARRAAKGSPIGTEQLLATIAELGAVDGIELKMNVPSEQRMALRALDVDPLAGKIREVVFYDTPKLDLFKAGVVVRGRRTQGSDDDTVVKLRPALPDDLPAEVRDSPNLKVEMDITRESHVVSVSLKGTRPAGTVRENLAGRRTLEKLMTKEQRPFLEAHLPKGLGWSDLMPLGPVYVVCIKAVPGGFSRKMTIEQWHFPGQVPLLELSTKATLADVGKVRREAAELLGGLGLEPTGEQQPKTRTAVNFFARHAG